jgi:chromosome segregation ATPase
MDYLKELNSDYEVRTKGLYARMEKISNRLASLTTDPQAGKRLRAKIEVLERKSREAFGDGKNEAVADCEDEIQKIRDKLQAQSEEILALNAESDQIQKQIDQAGGLTLSKVYPEIQQTVLEAWIHAIECAEKGWEALQRFEAEHGVKLSFHVHHGGLSPRRGDKSLQKRLEEWVD